MFHSLNGSGDNHHLNHHTHHQQNKEKFLTLCVINGEVGGLAHLSTDVICSFREPGHCIVDHRCIFWISQVLHEYFKLDYYTSQAEKNHRWISRWSKCKLIKYTYRRSVSVQLKTFLSYNIFVLHVHETQTHLILVMVMDWTCSAAGPNDSHNCKVILAQRQLSRRTANAR